MELLDLLGEGVAGARFTGSGAFLLGDFGREVVGSESGMSFD